MMEFKIKLDSEEMDFIETSLEVARKTITPEVFDRLGWDDREEFLGDVLRYGVYLMGQDPLAFVRTVRDMKDPIFKTSNTEEELLQRWEKGYA